MIYVMWKSGKGSLHVHDVIMSWSSQWTPGVVSRANSPQWRSDKRAPLNAPLEINCIPVM